MNIIVNCLLFWLALATGPLLVLLAIFMSGHKPEPKLLWETSYDDNRVTGGVFASSRNLTRAGHDCKSGESPSNLFANNSTQTKTNYAKIK